MKLVFATHNKNKLKEIKAMLPEHIELLSLDDIGCTEDIAETAETIQGNAALKAEYIQQQYGYDCFADDTGLEVEALDGAPGVYSARYAGDDKDSEANLKKLLREMEGKTDRAARFKTVIALRMENEEHFFTGICEGNILKEKRGQEGFGYDPIFQPEGFERTFAEMSLSEKAELSHRGKAFRKLMEHLSKQIND